MNNLQQPTINIAQTTEVVSEDGNIVFQEAFLLRRASKFLTGASEDAIIPIPCFVDAITGKICKELLPPEVKALYKDIM